MSSQAKLRLVNSIKSKKWADTMKILQNHPSLAHDKMINKSNGFESSALHMVCRRQPPLNLILSFLSLNQMCVKARDSLGRLPLHIACRYNAKCDVIRILIAVYPAGTSISAIDGTLPLHMACAYAKHKKPVQVLMDANPEASIHCDDMGLTPLDYANDNPDPIRFSLIHLLYKHIRSTTLTSAKKETKLANTETMTRTKQCVVCMDNDVSHILAPCGHPCLCQRCASYESLTQMKWLCPECRCGIQGVMKFFGRVVIDE